MPIAGSYFKLDPGVAETLRFDDFKKTSRSIKDPDHGWDKDVSTLELHVVEVNGEPVKSVWSVTSQVFQASIQPYLDNDKYKAYRFRIVQDPGAYRPPRIVSALIA